MCVHVCAAFVCACVCVKFNMNMLDTAYTYSSYSFLQASLNMNITKSITVRLTPNITITNCK